MSEVLDFNDYKNENSPHAVSEVICVRCCHRWIATWPEHVLLKDLVCPHCDQDGGVIITGQFIDEE